MPENGCSPRFPFLHWPLTPLGESVTRSPEDPQLEEHLAKARFSMRLLRYWWPAQAIRAEAARRPGERLTIVDYGSGRGWLKRFVGEDIDAHWIALDWQPQTKLLEMAGYDEIHACNFDHVLPLESQTADVVSALHVFEHLPRPAFSLVEIQRILAPGGCLLAGTPTMPSPLARRRQTEFRRLLEKGHIKRGGHINSLSPSRWNNLVEDAGLKLEFLTGSHLVRHTGNPLENWRPWIRFNQLWAALFPSLGSEACLRARKPANRSPEMTEWQAETLANNERRPRLAIAGLALAAVIAVAGTLFSAEQRRAALVERVLSAQLRMGAAHFLMLDHRLFRSLESHPDVTVIQSTRQIESRLRDLPADTHVVLHEDHLDDLGDPQSFIIDSRINTGKEDFYLIRRGEGGTRLHDFLSVEGEDHSAG